MRSRYTAYVRSDTAYLEATLLPRKRAGFSAQGTLDWNRDVVWSGLRVVGSGAGDGDDAAWVEFEASYVKAGEPELMHEVSRFRRKGGRWFYVDGRLDGEAQTLPVEGRPRVGRNAPCPCGSGRKFKHCCG